jgi:protein TonB
VEYPPALFDQEIGGTVVLRLFVTETGAVVPESTRVQESSGYPALDSAALAAAPKLRYAPATRNGSPVAAPFTQPVIFRAPERGGIIP